MKSIEDIKKHNEDVIKEVYKLQVPSNEIYLIYMYDGNIHYSIGNNYSQALDNYALKHKQTIEEHNLFVKYIMYFHRGNDIRFEWINIEQVVGWRMLSEKSLNEIISNQNNEILNYINKNKELENYLISLCQYYISLENNPMLSTEVINKSKEIVSAWQQKYNTKI